MRLFLLTLLAGCAEDPFGVSGWWQVDDPQADWPVCLDMVGLDDVDPLPAAGNIDAYEGEARAVLSPGEDVTLLFARWLVVHGDSERQPAWDGVFVGKLDPNGATLLQGALREGVDSLDVAAGPVDFDELDILEPEFTMVRGCDW